MLLTRLKKVGKRMKFKLVALSLILTVAFIAALINASKAKPKSIPQQIEESEAHDEKHGLTLQERVKLAKLRNEQKITVPMSYSNSLYAGFRDMDTAAANYTIIIAEPVAVVTRLDERGRIVSSYRFKTIEVLSEPGTSIAPYTFSGNLPAELGTFGDGDFLVSTLGGSKNIDGVEVTSKYDDFDLFSLNKKYLLFLDFDTTKTVGGLDMGPLSALEINADGTVNTLDKQESHTIKQVVDSRFGNSIKALKAHIKNQARRKD